MNTNTIFDLIAASATVITAIIAIIGLVFALRQVKEAKKARILDAYLVFENRLNDQREERNCFYEADLDDPTKLTYEDRYMLERVCVTFDILGVLLREDLMYGPLLFKPFYDVIIKSWKKAHNYIKFERQPYRKTQAYMLDFEYLYHQAEKYRRKNHLPEVEIYPPYSHRVTKEAVSPGVAKRIRKNGK